MVQCLRPSVADPTGKAIPQEAPVPSPAAQRKPPVPLVCVRVLIFKLQEKDQADTDPVEVIAEVPEELDIANGPPEATVARRAKSYSDFYDVVRAHIKKEKALGKEKRRSREALKTELEFRQWYNGVNDELLDASHEQYR